MPDSTTPAPEFPTPPVTAAVDPPPAPPAPKPEELRRAERENRKSVGAFDTDAARAAKKLAGQRISETFNPAADLARTHVAPKMHGVTDKMKAAGWKKIAVAVVLVCFVVLIVSLMG